MKLQRFVLACSLFATAGAFGALEEMVLGGWQLQDATVVEAQARKEGWYKQNSACQPTEGETLSRNGYEAKGWYKATVPGTVLTTLVDNGVYPEPTYGENNRPEVIPESLNRRDWWYRTKVTVPESFKDKTVWLNFDGINYQAEVWVNGRIAGRMTGAFKRASFDLARCDAKAGKDVTIAVRISPQPTVGVPSEHTMGTTGGPCGGVARLDGPTFGCSVGWDWLSGVRDREAGLWRKVTLTATGDAKLLDPQVVTDLPDLPKLDTATVTVKVPVRNLTEKALDGTLTVAFDDVKVEKKVALGAYETATVAFTPAEFAALTVKNPKLWWPNGLGEPALHGLKLSLKVGGQASDAKDVTFGMRTFSYFTEGKSTFALSVNGVRVFMRGGNWGLDEMLKRVRAARIDDQVRLHREGNFNMIRDWGGMSMSDELAAACDKYGILLWEDFWQFNSIDPVNTDLYFAHVRDSVLRLRNHASLVLWCSRNEATPPKYLDDDLKDLDTLPQVTLEARARTAEKDGQVLVAVELKNPSKAMAVMAHLQLRGQKSGLRVLPTTYSDNYISLVPGETKRVLVSCRKEQLKGEAPFVTVDGWNVTVAKGALVGPNEVASVDAPQWAHQKGFGFKAKPLVAKDVVRINCAGYNRGNFEKDPGFLEGPCGFRTEDVEMDGCPNAGPMDIYRTVRWGESTYSNLMTRANASYTVRLHLAESEKSKGPGRNRMDVQVNGRTVCKDLDPAAAGVNRAGTVDIPHVKSDEKGLVVLSFVKGRKIDKEDRDPRINGFEILPE